MQFNLGTLSKSKGPYGKPNLSENDQQDKKLPPSYSSIHAKQNFLQNADTTVKRIFSDTDQDEEDLLQRSAKRKRDLNMLMSQIEGEPGAEHMKSSNFNMGSTSTSSLAMDTIIYSHRLTPNLQSTNLRITNLHPSITEQDLCTKFAEFGPIASVKIMYPRTSEDSLRNRNNGFIAFMDRLDAERAFKEMDQKEFMSFHLHIGWGRPVPIPPQPFFSLPITRIIQNSDFPRFNGPIAPPSSLVASASLTLRQVQVLIPSDPLIRKRIDQVADRVFRNGQAFEDLIQQREQGNDLFEFIFKTSPLNTYYRWKIESFRKGDTLDTWSNERISMPQFGLEWLPPLLEKEGINESFDSDIDSDEEDIKERERVPEGTLGPFARSRYIRRLESLNGERGFVAKCMCMAIDHADAHEAIVDIIVKDIISQDINDLRPEKLINTICKLHVISDILHNSSLSLPHVWRYRASFEAKLNSVFSHLNQIYRNIDGRMKAEAFRKQVAHTLSAWESWMCFTAPFIDGLREVLERPMDKETCERLENSEEVEYNGNRNSILSKSYPDQIHDQEPFKKWKTI